MKLSKKIKGRIGLNKYLLEIVQKVLNISILNRGAAELELDYSSIRQNAR